MHRCSRRSGRERRRQAPSSPRVLGPKDAVPYTTLVMCARSMRPLNRCKPPPPRPSRTARVLAASRGGKGDSASFRISSSPTVDYASGLAVAPSRTVQTGHAALNAPHWAVIDRYYLTRDTFGPFRCGKTSPAGMSRSRPPPRGSSLSLVVRHGVRPHGGRPRHVSTNRKLKIRRILGRR